MATRSPFKICFILFLLTWSPPLVDGQVNVGGDKHPDDAPGAKRSSVLAPDDNDKYALVPYYTPGDADAEVALKHHFETITYDFDVCSATNLLVDPRSFSRPQADATMGSSDDGWTLFDEPDPEFDTISTNGNEGICQIPYDVENNDRQLPLHRQLYAITSVEVFALLHHNMYPHVYKYMSKTEQAKLLDDMRHLWSREGYNAYPVSARAPDDDPNEIDGKEQIDFSLRTISESLQKRDPEIAQDHFEEDDDNFEAIERQYKEALKRKLKKIAERDSVPKSLGQTIDPDDNENVGTKSENNERAKPESKSTDNDGFEKSSKFGSWISKESRRKKRSFSFNFKRTFSKNFFKDKPEDKKIHTQDVEDTNQQTKIADSFDDGVTVEEEIIDEDTKTTSEHKARAKFDAREAERQTAMEIYNPTKAGWVLYLYHIRDLYERRCRHAKERIRKAKGAPSGGKSDEETLSIFEQIHNMKLQMYALFDSCQKLCQETYPKTDCITYCGPRPSMSTKRKSITHNYQVKFDFLVVDWLVFMTMAFWTSVEFVRTATFWVWGIGVPSLLHFVTNSAVRFWDFTCASMRTIKSAPEFFQWLFDVIFEVVLIIVDFMILCFDTIVYTLEAILDWLLMTFTVTAYIVKAFWTAWRFVWSIVAFVLYTIIPYIYSTIIGAIFIVRDLIVLCLKTVLAFIEG